MDAIISSVDQGGSANSFSLRRVSVTGGGSPALSPHERTRRQNASLSSATRRMNSRCLPPPRAPLESLGSNSFCARSSPGRSMVSINCGSGIVLGKWIDRAESARNFVGVEILIVVPSLKTTVSQLAVQGPQYGKLPPAVSLAVFGMDQFQRAS